MHFLMLRTMNRICLVLFKMNQNER
jgi:hypothetical protein